MKFQHVCRPCQPTSLSTSILVSDGRRGIARYTRGYMYGFTRGRVEEAVGNIRVTGVVATSPLGDTLGGRYPKVAAVDPSCRQD